MLVNLRVDKKGSYLMSSGLRNFIILMLLPFMAAAGHDIYLNYFSDSDKIKHLKSLQVDPDKFLVSDLGWIWHTYHPKSMEMARTMVEPAVWTAQVDPILQMPSMLVGIVPFGIGCVFLVLAFVLGVWPFAKYGQLRRQKDEDFAVYKHAKSKAIQYKKK